VFTPWCDALKKDTLFRIDPQAPAFCLSSIKDLAAMFSFQIPHKCFQHSLNLELSKDREGIR
jgi:hypothetical protein